MASSTIAGIDSSRATSMPDPAAGAGRCAAGAIVTSDTRSAVVTSTFTPLIVIGSVSSRGVRARRIDECDRAAKTFKHGGDPCLTEVTEITEIRGRWDVVAPAAFGRHEKGREIRNTNATEI